MRIARVLTRLNLGGPARQVLASDPVLLERGHELRLFVGTPSAGEGDLFERARARGLDVRRVPGLRRGLGLGDLQARRALKRALLEYEPEVLHTHAAKAGALGRAAVRDQARVARVHTFHGHVLEGYFPPAISRRMVRHERKLAQSTDRILAVSHATADDLVRLGVVEEERLVVVPPGAELEPFLELGRTEEDRVGPLRRLVGAGPEVHLAGVVGRLVEVKRPERALAVFGLLAERHAHLQVVYVGDGPERGSLERAIGALPPALAERVHLVGAREEMAPVFAELDSVLHVSRAEGMPVALIEAAAAGLAVVSTPVGGVPELVAEERTGFLGESDEELAFALDKLCSDPQECRAMGQRARLRVKDRHSAKALADRLEEVYRIVIEERRCAS